MRRKLIAGNWKMYKTTAEAGAFAKDFLSGYSAKDGEEVWIFAPFTQLLSLTEAFRGTGISVGAQNVHFAEEGAYTGEISARMLSEIGVGHCLVGHSERRTYFNETDETVRKKIGTLLRHEMVPVLCIGETLGEREAGKAEETVASQLTGALKGFSASELRNLVIAYEPVWAIGTGKTATSTDAEEMCAFIRSELGKLFSGELAEKIRILYGGSVKPENVREILAEPDIDGALVGGASLSVESFRKLL